MNENAELIRFYQNLQQDIRSEQLSQDEGGTLEQLFTLTALNLLAEAGETENARTAYHESIVPRNRHKINGYAISDNYETLDLFVTIFKCTDEPERIQKSEIEDAAKLLVNFFSKSKYKEFAGELEESSEIFDLAHTLSDSPELKDNLVRVNAIILTDGVYSGTVPGQKMVSGAPIYFKVVDLNYLYNISEKSHVPIEIDFKSEGFQIPCIVAPSVNEEYQSYLAIIPASALVTIYERFGSRLLEQNVRSFLQFTGKINKGIRNTILKEPHMFLAFNNGIAATAESIEIETSGNGTGLLMAGVKDLQIVNGGQTTASIYHTWKKDKADISNIHVQVKLSVVKNKENFSDVVSRISEYANTQNKVSVSDLSSNRPYHIEIEKLSRSVWAPPVSGQSTQTRWFYERARGQYKNARIKEGFTQAKQKAFDLKNPKAQMFTKEDLAKYVNSYQEVVDGKKLLIGPHFVVRGNQKNYVQFINYNLPKKTDSIYFEDVIAKAILFRAAEKVYGIKPNAIGDMRYITVPYSIALLNKKTNGKLDLYKIWKAQSVSGELRELLYSLMVQVEGFIKEKAPGSLYGEWAKKEECWDEVKKLDMDIDLSSIRTDLESSKASASRKRISEEDSEKVLIEAELEKVKSVPATIWNRIEEWGKVTEHLSIQQQSLCWNLAGKVRNGSKISDYERTAGIRVIDLVIEKAPDILLQIDEAVTETEVEITLEVVKKIVEWDRRNKKLKDYQFKVMWDVANGKAPLTEQAKKYASWNLKFVERFGFKV